MATIEDLPALLSKVIKDGFDVPKQKMYSINEDAASGARPNSPIIRASTDHPVVEPASLVASNSNPASSPPHAQEESKLFSLIPAEIRNKIWRALLVTDKVYISFTNCRLLMAQRGARRRLREESPGARTAMRVSQFDERHVEYYGVLGDNGIGEEADLGTYFSPRRYHDDWAKYAMGVLAIKPPVKFLDSHYPRPQLDILLTCRKARLEAEPIFYSENCFTFCTCNQIHDYNAARDITSAHAAYCFLQDRSPEALKEIKSIELHVLHQEITRTAHFRRNDVAVWGEMAAFIKSHMSIGRLNIHIGGCLSEEASWRGHGNYMALRATHPEIDQLLDLPPVQRLSIRWTTPGFSPRVCDRHGPWCFIGTWHWRYCPLALESLAFVSFIKSLRCGLLENGEKLGLSQIRGGLAFNTTNQQADSIYVAMETDDDNNGKSHLATHQGSFLTQNNFGWATLTSPRWPFDEECMESISDDFHESLKKSRARNRQRFLNEVTFHLIWLDCIDASSAVLAVDCEAFWGNTFIRKELNLTIEAPLFTRNTVQVAHEADARHYRTYGEWRDALRHLLQFTRWCLQFVDLWHFPKRVNHHELHPGDLYPTSGQLGNTYMATVAPRIDCGELRMAIEDGEPDQTIVFTCRPAWECFQGQFSMWDLWDSELLASSTVHIDRTNGLLLQHQDCTYEPRQ